MLIMFVNKDGTRTVACRVEKDFDVEAWWNDPKRAKGRKLLGIVSYYTVALPPCPNCGH